LKLLEREMTIIVYLRSSVPKRRDTNLDGVEQTSDRHDGQQGQHSGEVCRFYLGWRGAQVYSVSPAPSMLVT
jgi:hypothetical protein